MRETTIKRHKIVANKFEELINRKFDHGLKPSYDSVIEVIHHETGYSISYVERIVRERE